MPQGGVGRRVQAARQGLAAGLTASNRSDLAFHAAIMTRCPFSTARAPGRGAIQRRKGLGPFAAPIRPASSKRWRQPMIPTALTARTPTFIGRSIPPRITPFRKPRGCALRRCCRRRQFPGPGRVAHSLNGHRQIAVAITADDTQVMTDHAPVQGERVRDLAARVDSRPAKVTRWPWTLITASPRGLA